MTKLVLLSGFLGAGKTTLMQQILTNYRDSRVGVIVNEFGEINIDARLIENEGGEGMQMAELSNGSIFCACIKDKFVDSLIEMSVKNLDYLFIEASGLADPANINQILDGIRNSLLNPYDYRGAICVLDGESFLELFELLPAITNQLVFCSAAVINKIDLIDEETLGEITAAIREVNPDADIYVTSYCRIDVREVVESLTQNTAEAKETTNTVESRPLTFIVKGTETLPLKKLSAFLESVCADTYRIKGFAETDEGVKEISAVGKNIHINDWDRPVEGTEIVVISSVGIRMMSELTKSLKEHLDGLAKL